MVPTWDQLQGASCKGNFSWMGSPGWVNNGQIVTTVDSTGWDGVISRQRGSHKRGRHILHRAPRWDRAASRNLKIWISYSLSKKGRLRFPIKSRQIQDSLVNPTNHSYFNLSGNFSQPIDQHQRGAIDCSWRFCQQRSGCRSWLKRLRKTNKTRCA